MTNFGFETTGAEVVETFKDQVNGKTILITGAGATGLGAGMAIALARGNPAHLILQARSLPRIQPVLDDIKSIAPSLKTTFVPFDLSDPASVRAAASEISNKVAQIDLLVNNAGIMAVHEYTLGKTGNEIITSTNHFGPFLLTKLLIPKILASGPDARIVNISSIGHRISPFRFDDWNFSDRDAYNFWTAYGQSKTANILFTRGLASRGILSFSCHPGSIFDTNLSNNVDMSHFDLIADIARANTGKMFELDKPKSLEQGISTMLVAALDPGLKDKNGVYLKDCQIEEEEEYARDPENVERLWDISERVVGEKFELNNIAEA